MRRIKTKRHQQSFKKEPQSPDLMVLAGAGVAFALTQNPSTANDPASKPEPAAEKLAPVEVTAEISFADFPTAETEKVSVFVFTKDGFKQIKDENAYTKDCPKASQTADVTCNKETKLCTLDAGDYSIKAFAPILTDGTIFKPIPAHAFKVEACKHDSVKHIEDCKVKLSLELIPVAVEEMTADMITAVRK